MFHDPFCAALNDLGETAFHKALRHANPSVALAVIAGDFLSEAQASNASPAQLHEGIARALSVPDAQEQSFFHKLAAVSASEASALLALNAVSAQLLTALGDPVALCEILDLRDARGWTAAEMAQAAEWPMLAQALSADPGALKTAREFRAADFAESSPPSPPGGGSGPAPKGPK